MFLFTNLSSMRLQYLSFYIIGLQRKTCNSSYKDTLPIPEHLSFLFWTGPFYPPSTSYFVHCLISVVRAQAGFFRHSKKYSRQCLPFLFVFVRAFFLSFVRWHWVKWICRRIACATLVAVTALMLHIYGPMLIKIIKYKMAVKIKYHLYMVCGRICFQLCLYWIYQNNIAFLRRRWQGHENTETAVNTEKVSSASAKGLNFFSNTILKLCFL